MYKSKSLKIYKSNLCKNEITLMVVVLSVAVMLSVPLYHTHVCLFVCVQAAVCQSEQSEGH